MKNKTLYILWAVLFALCAVLGFFRETVTEGRWLMTALSVLFFVPPGALLWRARKKKDEHTRLLIRDLSGASLALTLVLLVANLMAALGSEWLGNFLDTLLTVLSTPMKASGYWALSLFLWAFLFIASLKGKK
jgi:hypothetical protein